VDLGNNTTLLMPFHSLALARSGIDTYISSATSFVMDANVENLTMSSGAGNAIGNSG